MNKPRVLVAEDKHHILDLVAGRVSVTSASAISTMPHVRAGKQDGYVLKTLLVAGG